VCFLVLRALSLFYFINIIVSIMYLLPCQVAVMSLLDLQVHVEDISGESCCSKSV